MKLVIQRVQEASVSVDQEVVGKIDHGFMVLLGVSQTDTEEIADKMIQKLLKLRIFEDENGKTNLDIKSVNGKLLIISQFTLYADCKHGNRPSFINATKYVCHWDESFGTYLAKKRAEGKHYNVALSHATKKLVRTIYAMEKSGHAYTNAA